MKRFLCLALVAVFATSCGGTKAHSDIDVNFARQLGNDESVGQLIAEQGATHGDSQRVRDAAAAISRSQTDDVQKAQSWLSKWDPAGSAIAKAQASQLPPELVRTTGPAFDKAFLTTMIQRHQATIAIADAEAAGGTNTDAKHVARDVKSARSAEVGEMQGLLVEVQKAN